MDGENAELTEQSIMLACKGQSCSTNAWILRLTSCKEVSTFKRCGANRIKVRSMVYDVLSAGLLPQKAQEPCVA